MDEIRNILLDDAVDTLSARTLVVDLLDTGDPLDFSTRDFVRAGAAFGIEPTGIRTALTRLKAEGRVSTPERGRYAIGAEGEPLRRRILGWRDALARRRAWEGKWLIAVAGPHDRADRTVWRRTVRALELEGFAEAETNIWARPDNLTGGVAGVRDALAMLGGAASLLVVEADGLDEDRASRFPDLWPAATLAAAHLRRALQLDQSAAALDTANLAAAAAETLLLGRQAIRAIMRDPLLPDALCPSQPLATLIAAMNRYHRLGKRVWTAYLAGSGDAAK